MKYFFVTAVLLLIAALARGQTNQTRFIAVTGSDTVRAPSDLAIIQIGVITENASAQDAVSENNNRSNLLRDQLTSLFGSFDNPEANTVETSEFSVLPIFNFTGDISRIVGFRATHILEIRTPQLDRIGEVIDEALAGGAGANTIQSISFDISNQEALRNQALENAVLNGASAAEAMAGALNVTLGPILEASQSTAQLFPAPRLFGAMESTNIAPGNVAVSAMVNLKYEISEAM